jgi:fatty acid desaturase
MHAPYKRIVVLHVAIIAGGFLVTLLGSPAALLVALVALKTGMDIMLHNRSHNSDPQKESKHGNRRNIRTADTDR